MTTTKDGENAPTRPFKYRIIFCLAVTVTGVLILAISAVVLIVVALGLKSDIASLQREWSTFQQNISRASENTAASVEHNSEELAELKLNYSEFLEQFSLLSRNSTLYSAAIQQLKADLECPTFVFSCASIPSYCPSGYYLTVTVDGSVEGIFCDMTLSCGNITGGWMRVAKLNMTDTSQQCPSGLVENNETGIRQCQAEGVGCLSVNYSISNLGYVAELQPTKLDTPMHFENILTTKIQRPSTLLMWMVLVSLMETQESTSGHLQLLWTEMTM